VLTEDVVKLERIWPETFRRAVAALRHKGIDGTVAEDAVQEAAVRAIAHAVPFKDADDLLRWVQTVAWHVVLDRRKCDKHLVYDAPDAPSSEDTEVTVECRMRLARVGELLSSLTSAERAALAEHHVAGMDRREDTRWAVRRHRARAHLLAMLEGLGLLVAWLRRRATATRVGRRSVTVAIAVPLLAASVMVLVPHFRDAPSQLPAQTQPVRSAPLPSGAATESAGATTGSRAGESATVNEKPPASTPLPRVEIDIPPSAGGGSAWGRPKEPDDHFVCVDLIVVGHHCTDLPVRITD
jgi:hypothetical protein